MCVLYRLGKGERREEGRWGYGEGEIKEGRCGKRTRGDEKNEKKGTDRGVRKREGEWGRRGERRERWGGGKGYNEERRKIYGHRGRNGEEERGVLGGGTSLPLVIPSWYCVYVHVSVSRGIFLPTRGDSARIK